MLVVTVQVNTVRTDFGAYEPPRPDSQGRTRVYVELDVVLDLHTQDPALADFQETVRLLCCHQTLQARPRLQLGDERQRTILYFLYEVVNRNDLGIASVCCREKDIAFTLRDSRNPFLIVQRIKTLRSKRSDVRALVGGPIQV
jgi:hypothetical protein